jgi:hypothetical protein
VTSRVEHIASETAERYPMIAGGLITRWSDPDSPTWAAAERAAHYLSRLQHINDDFAESIDKFARTSIDFLRLQARFLKSGVYACGSAGALVGSLYEDADEMRGHYLDGLAMTYVLWPNHAAMLEFLDARFVPAISANATVIDISSHALEFVETAFDCHGLARTRASFLQMDVTKATSPYLHQVQAMICCEVLEHVHQPDLILKAIRSQLADDGLAFVSSVANLEAIDHVFLFQSAAHIRETIEAAGFFIVDERALEVPGSRPWGVEAINYSAIIRPA